MAGCAEPAPGRRQTWINDTIFDLCRKLHVMGYAHSVEAWRGRVGRTPSRVLVRNQKTQWGSCGEDGTIRFNWQLAMADPKLLEYVVVHEMVLVAAGVLAGITGHWLFYRGARLV